MSEAQQTPEVIKRGVHPRPEQRAEQREESRDPQRDTPRLQRRIRQGTDRTAIPKHLIPSGMEMEWKRYETAGKEDGFYQADLRANHWAPVNAEDFPELAPFGQTSGPIKGGDLMIMMRPDYLCEDARQEHAAMTNAKMMANASKVKDAPPGTFERDHKNITPQIRKAARSVVTADDFE